MTGRPRTGTVVRTRDGRLQAVVTLADGSRKRISPPFPNGTTMAYARERAALWTEEAQRRGVRRKRKTATAGAMPGVEAMPKESTGEVLFVGGRWIVRVTRGKSRRTVPLPVARTEEEAKARGQVVAQLARRFRKADALDERAWRLVNLAGEAPARALPDVHTLADELLSGMFGTGANLVGLLGEQVPAADLAVAFRVSESAILKAAEQGRLVAFLRSNDSDFELHSCPTVSELAQEWVSGDAARRYPDYVGEAEWLRGYLERLCGVDIGQGQLFGDVEVQSVTLRHAERAMSALQDVSKNWSRPVSAVATRRRYAKALLRLLDLAVYPMRLLDRNPIPAEFVP